MRRWLFVLAGLLALQAAPRAETNPFHAGQTRFVAGDYQGAYELWLPEAQAGDARAQFSIGVLYQQGLGVPRSVPTAAEWYAQAARQGYAPALTALRALAPHLGQPAFEGWKSPREREAALVLEGTAAAARPRRRDGRRRDEAGAGKRLTPAADGAAARRPRASPARPGATGARS